MWDLAEAHVAAVEQFDQALAKVDSPGTIINLGTGDGVTVRELVAAFEKVFGKPVPVREAGPRPGDAIGAFANADKAREILGWSTKLTIEDGIDSALAWARKRREILGYESASIGRRRGPLPGQPVREARARLRTRPGVWSGYAGRPNARLTCDAVSPIVQEHALARGLVPVICCIRPSSPA